MNEAEGPDIISVNDSCFEEFVAGSSRRVHAGPAWFIYARRWMWLVIAAR